MNGRKRIKLTKAGVFLLTGKDKQRIAAPIRFHAIGERSDRTRVVEIRFEDCDGERASEQFDMAAINSRNLSTIADALGNKGYLWPADGASAVEYSRWWSPRYRTDALLLWALPVGTAMR